MKKIIKVSIITMSVVGILTGIITTASTKEITPSKSDKVENIDNLYENKSLLLDSNLDIKKLKDVESISLDYDKLTKIREELLTNIKDADKKAYEEKLAKEKEAEEKAKKERLAQEKDAKEKAEQEKARKETLAKEKSKSKKNKEENTSKNNDVKADKNKSQSQPDPKQPSKVENKSIVSNSSVNTYGMSPSDYDLFLAIVDCEAGGEGYDEVLAVANVIYNRLKFGWGNTLTDVIYARNQFTPAKNGRLASKLNEKNYSANTRRAVADTLQGKNNIGTAQSFNLYYGKEFPGKTVIIGSTIFYNFK